MALLPRRTRAPTASSAASMVMELAGRETIEPRQASIVLDLKVVTVEQVTPYRREYQLGSNALWVDATAIVGGEAETWRLIDLVPRELSIIALRLDSPYELRPHMKHTLDGPTLIALEHHHQVAAGRLVIWTQPGSTRIDRITLSNDRCSSSSAT